MPDPDDHDRQQSAVADVRRLTEDELVAAIERSEADRRAGRERTGRLLAELYRRGRWSWPAISRRTGIPQTTLYDLAQPFMTPDDGPEQQSP